MSIRISQVNSQLTLIFDRPSNRFSRTHLESIQQRLSSVEGVKSVRMQTTWFGSRQMTIDFASELEPHTMLRKMASALRPVNEQPLSNGHVVPAVTAPAQISAVVRQTAPSLSSNKPVIGVAEETPIASSNGRSLWRHVREFGYGILAVASLGMSWVGLIVPGIPTVPFVILTAHFALQASPALRQRLLRSRMFGPMMRDWHEHRAIHRSIQIEAYIFTVVIIAISFAIAPPNPLLHAVMAFMGVLGLIMISRIPVIQLKEDDNSVEPLSQNSSVTPAVA